VPVAPSCIETSVTAKLISNVSPLTRLDFFSDYVILDLGYVLTFRIQD
jgi:hypothetical protein